MVASHKVDKFNNVQNEPTQLLIILNITSLVKLSQGNSLYS